MGKRVEEDAHVKMEKKLKKSKNKTDVLLDADDDNCHVEVDTSDSKKKSHKHKEKKRKSKSNEDGDENRPDKEKKRKSKSNEDGDENRPDKEKNRKSKSNEDGDEDRPDKDKKEEKKRKSKSNEDRDEDRPDKVKKKDKKRKQDSSEDNQPSEMTQIEENEKARDNELAVEKDCDPKPRKEKKRNHKHHESELENDGKKVDKKKKKKEKKIDNQDSDAEPNGITTNESGNKERPKPKGKSKKVSFSGQVEVFPFSDTEMEKHKTKGDGLIRGKRFTPEEDKIVKEAVLNYILVHNLGDEGLKKVLTCQSHKGMKKCWQEIATCIPYRPSSAVYYRAHILFERAESRKWTHEELEYLRELHEKEGNKWKHMAEELGKHRFHVKDTWRRIKLKDMKSGRWSQEEYQGLYDLVNLDLKMKVFSEVKQSKHGMLRDNIPWSAISDKLSTRAQAACCIKWYNQLTSSLVAEKKWSDADDYRLIGALYELDAACMEDVDWDGLLEHRPGEICRKRWNQMVRHIGHHGSRPFSEQVDTLAQRYCPDLAETREDWDNKPVV